MTGRTEISCILCGTALTEQTAPDHRAVCQPRRSYWWPRANPHSYAALALLVGLFLGSLLCRWL